MRGGDRKGTMEREWKQRNFIHDFPRVPEVKHFGRCALVRARATTAPPRGISLTKLLNHACIMRFADQKNTASGKKGRSAGRTARLIITAAAPLSRWIFSCFGIKLIRTARACDDHKCEILSRDRDGRLQRSFNYVCHDRSCNNERKFLCRA